MCDVKVIPNKECVTQHKLLDTRIVKSEDWCKKFVPKWCVWKLQQADLCDKFCETLTGKMNDTSGEQVNNIWSRLKQGLLSATERLVGGQRRAYGENKRGCKMKRSVRIYLRREVVEGGWEQR